MITEKEQKYMAQRVARWLSDRLISTTQIERAQVLRAAQEAGNAAAQTLRRSLEEIE
jgi:hypothetical protein